MGASVVGSRWRQVLYYAAGLAGVFLALDALLAFAFVALSSLLGGQFNPYFGIVVFVMLPIAMTVGIVVTLWAFGHIWPQEASREAAAGQGH